MLKNLLNNSRPYLENLTEKFKKVPKPRFLNKFPDTWSFRISNKKKNLEESPNLSYIKELSNSDINFRNEFLQTLSEEYSSELQAYLFCIEMGAPRAAAGKVGKLKHKFDILGMKSAFKFAERHQRKLQKGNKSSDGKFKKILAKGNRFLMSQLQVYHLLE